MPGFERKFTADQPVEIAQPAQNKPADYNVGSFLLGLLPGGSLIDKGIRGEQITGGDVALEAALSAIPFGLGKIGKAVKGGVGLVKGISTAAKLGEDLVQGAKTGINIANAAKVAKPGLGFALENIGTKTLGIQSAGALGKDIASLAPKTYKQLSKYGINDVNKFADIASNITGQEGAVNLAKMNILSNAKKTINLGNWVEESSKPLLTSVGLKNADKTAIKHALSVTNENILKNTATKVPGRAVGIGEAHPEALYKGYQDLTKLAGDRPGRMASDAVKTKYDVLSSAARSLKEKAFSSAGDGILSDIAKKEIVADLRSRGINNTNLLKDVLNAKNLQDLNKIESVFVTGSDIGKDVAESANLRTLTGTNAGIKDAVMSSLISPASRFIGGGASSLGRGLQSIPKGVTSLVPQAGVRAVADTMGRIQPADAQMSTSIDQNLFNQQSQPSQSLFGQQISGIDQQAQSQQTQQSPYPKENLLYDMQRDPENADKYLAYYQAVSKTFEPQTKPVAAFGKPSAQLYSQATTGLQSLNNLVNMISKDKNIISKNMVPGQELPLIGSLVSGALGTSDYRAISNNILNSIARINTGAAMPASEEAFYAKTYLPQAGDSEATINTKIQNLVGFFSPIANYDQYQGQSSLEDALMQQGQY